MTHRPADQQVTDQPSRVEGVALVFILLVVGGVAGAASFTHVKDWTMANSPADTPEWFGWANAVISELIPIAALLTIRRRKRVGAPIGYPMFLLVCAVLLSLSAQLAVAKPGISGWLLSAVPALAFLGLSKLVLTTGPKATPAPTPDPDQADQVDEPDQGDAHDQEQTGEAEQRDPVVYVPLADPVPTLARAPAAAERPIYRTPPAPPRSALAPTHGHSLS